jgi:acyl carrier protein
MAGSFADPLEETKRTLRRLIQENSGIPAAVVDDDSTIDGDLLMDSMSFVSLQVAVEETFGILCSPEEIQAANRFGAIAALVHERSASQAEREAMNRSASSARRAARVPGVASRRRR